MARIRATLWRMDPRHRAATANEAESASAGEEDEIPFIEVGGRQTPIEGSPSVLAGLGQQHHAGKASSAGTTIPAPLFPRIAFRPLPPSAQPLRPAAERFSRELVSWHEPDHPLSEQYKGMLSHLDRPTTDGEARTRLFLAPAALSQATSVLLNLAIACARQPSVRTLVLDANGSSPGIAERLGLPPAPGLGEVLAEQVALRHALQETGQPNLSALTAGAATPERQEWCSGEALAAMLRQLRPRFDWIFIRGPNVEGEWEESTLLSACEGVYLVVAEADADTEAVETWRQDLVEMGAAVQGYFLVGRA